MLPCDACAELAAEIDREPSCRGSDDYRCPRAMMRENPLLPENEEALYMYGMTANQLCYDLHLAPFVLECFGYPAGEKKTCDLIERLILIHASRSRRDEEEEPNPDHQPASREQ